MPANPTQTVRDQTVLSLASCQRRLIVLWIAGVIPPFILTFARTLNYTAPDESEQAWGWLLTTVMPSLSLAIGTYAVSQRKPKKDKLVERFWFRVSFFISALYLATVNATLLLLPFSSRQPLETMHQMGIGLALMQGLVTTCLGVFFSSEKA